MKKNELVLIVYSVLIFCPVFVFAGQPFYVDCSAKINGDGSYESPWNDIASVNDHNFNTGDDVYFKINTSCIPDVTLNIDYGANKFGLNGGSRPIIDGNNHTVPEDWQGLVQMVSPSLNGHVTVRDLHITNSRWHGILTNYADDVEVINCYVYRSGANGISVARCLGGSVSDNTVDHAGYTNATGVSNAGIAANAVGVEGATDSVIISRNRVFSCESEGIDIIRGATNCVVEHNVIYDIKNVGVYISNNNDAVVRYNVIYSSTRGRPDDGGRMPQGIEVQNETWDTPRGDRNRIYGNLIAACSNGIKLVPIGGSLTNTWVFNNTIVDCDYNFYFGNVDESWSNNKFINNISWTISTGSKHMNSFSVPSVTWNCNNFDDPVTIKASNGMRIGDPGLMKTMGWRAIPPGEENTDWWHITPNSENVGAGTHLTQIAKTETLPVRTAVVYDSYCFRVGDYIHVDNNLDGTIDFTDQITSINLANHSVILSEAHTLVSGGYVFLGQSLSDSFESVNIGMPMIAQKTNTLSPPKNLRLF
jgi:hypothetical protein